MLARLLEVADAGAAAFPLRQSVKTPPAPAVAAAPGAGWPLFVGYGMSETAAIAGDLRRRPTAGWGWSGDHCWHDGRNRRRWPRIRVRGPQLIMATSATNGRRSTRKVERPPATSARIDADGRLTVLARADDMLVSAGVALIDPAEDPAYRLSRYPATSPVAAEMRPVWGDVLAALLVGNADAGAVR